jgi:hypothetical protein
MCGRYIPTATPDKVEALLGYRDGEGRLALEGFAPPA